MSSTDHLIVTLKKGYTMKKYLTLLVAAATMFGASALYGGGVYKTGTLTVTNGATKATLSLTNPNNYTVSFADADGDFKAIDKIILNHASGIGTGTVAVAVQDLGVTTSLASSALTNGVSTSTTPRVDFVFNAATTNKVMYNVRSLKVSVTQIAITATTNSVNDVYRWSVYAVDPD